ncbi:unnamed protein product [Cochlearia groenlandica]
MVAACCEEETLRSTILSFFMASSTDELYAVFREVVSVVLPDGSAGGGPKIANYHYQYITAYDGFKVLKLPYKQGLDNTHRALSMYFYLPDNNDGLDNLLVRMASTNGFLDNHIPSHEVSVGEFRIPKFKIEFGFNATKVFNGLDLNVPMYQKAFIEIDEEGTEAAAVTVTTGFGACSMPKRINFVVDHPFIFLIREDRTGTILFAGQIFDPSKSSSA